MVDSTGEVKLDEFESFASSLVSPDLGQPMVLLSPGKAGTHLLRNLLMGFIPYRQVHLPFVHQHEVGLISARAREGLRFFCGHLDFSAEMALDTADCRRVLLVRDPAAIVLSYARFLYSEESARGGCQISKFFRERQPPFTVAVRSIIQGIAINGSIIRPIDATLKNAVLGWIGLVDCVVRYEELASAVRGSAGRPDHAYFSDLLGRLGLAMPDDWADRILSCTSERLSATASSNFTDLPDDCSRSFLTGDERRLLESAMGRAIEWMGYA